MANKSDLNILYSSEAYLYWAAYLNAPYFNSSGTLVPITYGQSGFRWSSTSSGQTYVFTDRDNLLSQLQGVLSAYTVTATEYNSKLDTSALLTEMGTKIINSGHNVALTISGSVPSQTLYADLVPANGIVNSKFLVWDGITIASTSYDANSFAPANWKPNYNLASDSQLSGILPVSKGGSGNNTFTGSQFLWYNATSGKVEASGYSNSSFLTTESSLDVAHLSAAVPIAKGGTNATSFTANQVLYFNGTSIVSTGVAYNAYLNTASSLNVANLSGAVPIAKGGTNATSFTTNQALYFNGTSIVSTGVAYSAYLNTGSNLDPSKLSFVSIAANTQYCLFGKFSTAAPSGTANDGFIWIQYV